MKHDETEDPRLPAAVDVVRRTGAKEVQIRYSDDEDPVVWFAVAGHIVHNGKLSGTGKINQWTAAAAMSPLRAVFKLCDELVDGGRCAHCGKPSGFIEGTEETILDEHICWWVWDVETIRYVQQCQL